MSNTRNERLCTFQVGYVDAAMNVTGSGYGVECVGEYCQENCSACIANCGIHRLKSATAELIEFLRADFVSECVNDNDKLFQNLSSQQMEEIACKTDTLEESLMRLPDVELHSCKSVC